MMRSYLSFDLACSFFILVFTLFQDLVIKKLSSILPTILTNFGQGTAKVNTLEGTQGRAETSNIPIRNGGRGVKFFIGIIHNRRASCTKRSNDPMRMGFIKISQRKKPGKDIRSSEKDDD